MIGKLDGMVVAAAFTESMAGMRFASEVLGAKLDDAQRDELVRSIRDRGVDYVVQEAVTLSSMPVWRDGRLQPRPFTLAPVPCQGRRALAGDARRFRAHRRACRRARRQPAARRRHRRCLGAHPRPGRRDDAACRIRSGCRCSVRRGCCRAAPPTICSGSAAMSSAPRRRCGSFAP